MLQETLDAIERGERYRARDLLTRLIKTDANNVQYWLWMSAVVDTPKERIYCLKEAIRVDPENQVARRGLILLGAEAADGQLAIPADLQKQNWQINAPTGAARQALTRTSRQIMLYFGGLVLLGVVVVGIIFGLSSLPQAQIATPVARFAATAAVSDTPTQPAISRTPGKVAVQPTPLEMMLKATYTPTPLYVNTPHPANEAYRTGLSAYQRGDWEAVIRYMEQLLEAEPKSADAHYLIGEASRFLKKNSDALRAYEEAIRLDPKFGAAYLGRARIRIATNRLKDARNDLQKAIDLDSNLGEAYLELAVLDTKNKDFEQALKSLDEAAARMPQSAVVFLYRAQTHIVMQNYTAAMQDARRANEIDLTLLQAYRVLAEAQRGAGEYAASIEPLKMYLQYVPDDTEALVWLGGALAASKDAEAALAIFDRVIEQDKRSFVAYLERGRLYLEQQNYEAAVADLKQAERLRSTSFPACFYLGRALQLSQKNGDAYMQYIDCQKVAKTDGEWAQMRYYRALTLEDMGQVEAAIKDWKALLALPEEALQAGWADTARQHLDKLFTPTSTPRTPTLTRTPRPTSTKEPTRTRWPSATKPPTRTPQVSATPSP